ncbi:MAG: hypothetical protein F6J89_02150 [Symploca sp. SIO1C4]|uniref:Uncharacterized protein n=1 Tax=Symploca sp. SIO1C4 TaxID=2607765 RepID=A0A6B3N4K4_9CYAN|nr:hypothetical protein [Symploca sp. SIO1C4]
MAGKLGPRVTMQIGKDKNGKPIYSYVLKSTAENFGFNFLNRIAQRKGKKGQVVVQRGSVGAGSIKVPLGPRKKTPKGNPKMGSIPMGAGMNIPKIQEFLKTAKKNKPEYFVTLDGRSWPVN